MAPPRRPSTQGPAQPRQEPFRSQGAPGRGPSPQGRGPLQPGGSSRDDRGSAPSREGWRRQAPRARDEQPRQSSGPRGVGPSTRKPALTPQVTTLWDYPSQHYGDEEQGSQHYRGATPSYVIWNVLSRFTAPGDVVLDPFCGSGTTLDVCKDLERKGLGFDLVPSRPDIQQADARSLPLKHKSVDLVFMDPPYADNLDYSEDPRCIGKLKGDGRYQRAMRLVIGECARVLRDGKTLAIYVCDVFQKGRGFYPLGFDLFQLTREHFVPIDVISVVRHNRTLQMGNFRKAADEGGFYLRGFNYLMLFRRKAGGVGAGGEGEEA